MSRFLTRLQESSIQMCMIVSTPPLYSPRRRPRSSPECQPAGAFDPKREAGAGTSTSGVPPPEPTPGSQEWQKQQGEGATQVIVEGKMPFKDQVKAWAKVHRGTVRIHYWIPISFQ
jgi:hypothetical protein